MLASAGIPIIDVPFVTVGGGMGSFVMVDYLKIAGVPGRPDQGPDEHQLRLADV